MTGKIYFHALVVGFFGDRPKNKKTQSHEFIYTPASVAVNQLVL